MTTPPPPPEQLMAKYFYDGVGIREKYKWIITTIIKSDAPDWVKTAVNSLDRGKKGNKKILNGSYKVVVIDEGMGIVYTMEILKENKMMQKQYTYAMLRQVPQKIQVKLPIYTFKTTISEHYCAYFTQTDYCQEVFSLIGSQNNIPIDFLDQEIVRLMETYKTLCDNNIYLVDIKPENMIKCADGLYFIDVDDISVVKDDFIRISETRTPYYSTNDYSTFLKNKENYTLQGIRGRLEYEGWQALAKTYFLIGMKGHPIGYFDERKGELRKIYKLSTRQWANYNKCIGRFFVFIFNEYNVGREIRKKNKDMRIWLENHLQSTSQPMDLGLTAITHLRF